MIVNVPYEDFLYYAYFSSSALLSSCVLEWLLVQLRRITGIKFKLFCCNNTGKIILFFCFFYNAWFLWKKGEFYSYWELLISLGLSCMYIGCKQISGYSEAEINTCLEDNESIGAYWALQTYDSFYKISLENIKDRIMSFEEKYNVKLFCKKLLIVIPLSCDVESTFTEKDDTLKYFGSLKAIENDQGANVNRKYENAVYRISSTQDVYIVAEYSNPVRALWKSRFNMKKEKLRYIRDCYIKALKRLVQGSPCIVVEYNDTVHSPETLSSCLLRIVEKESHFI